MQRIIMCWIIFFFLPFCSYASTNPPKKIKRVIYVTVDGVRWQDIFLDRHYLATFWKKYAKSAAIYGEPGSKATMEVASIPVSLPSYQSQMTGKVQPCPNNECGRVNMPTLGETLVNQFGFQRKDVASISCWEIMDNAIESVPGTTFSNNGTRPMVDPITNKPDEEMARMNQLQEAAYPGDDTRPDKFTLMQALHYLEKYQPTFLWISFGDADDYAHEGNLTEYHHTLYFYDHAIDKLLTLLKKLHLDEETMVIITTDHGRGDGENWREHGEEYPESKQTWAFVLNGELLPDNTENGMQHYSTLSIRPTIEQVLRIH